MLWSCPWPWDPQAHLHPQLARADGWPGSLRLGATIRLRGREKSSTRWAVVTNERPKATSSPAGPLTGHGPRWTGQRTTLPGQLFLGAPNEGPKSVERPGEARQGQLRGTRRHSPPHRQFLIQRCSHCLTAVVLLGDLSMVTQPHLGAEPGGRGPGWGCPTCRGALAHAAPPSAELPPAHPYSPAQALPPSPLGVNERGSWGF